MTRSLMWRLILIAVMAVGVRLAYQAGMDAFGGSFNNGSDSGKYINVAQTIATTGQFATTAADGHTEPATNRLPVYLYFVAAVFELTHSQDLRLIVTIQSFFDGLSVVAIGMAAMAISSRFVLPAALMAALIPNFIVQSSYILQESLFLVFFTWGLCAILWSVRARHPLWLLIAAGLLFGLALITRLAMAYYGFFLVPALFYALMARGQHSWVRSAGLSLVPVAAMVVVAAPLMIHNYMNYGYAALSSQSGSHILNWFYACLATPQPCAGRVQVLAQLNEIQHAELERPGGSAANPFAFSEFQTRVAIAKIRELPLWHIATAMTLGITKTLLQSGFYQTVYQFNQPATFLSAVKGADLPSQVWSFISTNRTNYFMWMWCVAELCLVVSRIFQFYGLFQGARLPQIRPYTALLFATTAYFLLILGPVSSPRYRIPAEPTLILLFAIGFVTASDRYWRRSSSPSADVHAAVA